MNDYRDRVLDLLWARITLKLQFAHDSLLFTVRLAVIVNGGGGLSAMALLLHLSDAPKLTYWAQSAALVFALGLLCAVLAGYSVRKQAAREIDEDLTTILPPHIHSDTLSDIEDQLIALQPTARQHPAVSWLRISLFFFILGLVGILFGMEADFRLSERFF